VGRTRQVSNGQFAIEFVPAPIAFVPAMAPLDGIDLVLVELLKDKTLRGMVGLPHFLDFLLLA